MFDPNLQHDCNNMKMHWMVLSATFSMHSFELFLGGDDVTIFSGIHTVLLFHSVSSVDSLASSLNGNVT